MAVKINWRMIALYAILLASFILVGVCQYAILRVLLALLISVLSFIIGAGIGLLIQKGK